MGPEGLFLANLELIERLARSTCQRSRMSQADIEDFTSALKLKLLENDYAVLRQFQGRSSFSTFLYVVVRRFHLDERDHEWGRWRSSAEARRQGDAAVLLEQCRHRDQMTVAEASQVVLRKHPEVTDFEIQRILAALPEREPRTRLLSEQEGSIESLAAPRAADDSVLAGERRDRAERASRAFGSVLPELSPDDQLILRLRFGQALKVVTIANLLQLDQRRLYTTIERLIAILRKALLAEGLAASDIRELLEHGAEGVEIPFLQAEGGPACPQQDFMTTPVPGPMEHPC